MNFIHRMLRISFLALLTIVLVSESIVGANPAQDVPPDPQPRPRTGIRWLDHIYWGAVPPQADRQPVLVFVHGLARNAEDWWTETEDYGVNDMYYAAYQAGYRTAFVTLHFPEKADPNSMWDNGETLSRQVEFIASDYDVDQVDIVAHSKGGIDAQAAVVYYGAWQHVRNVFTLGTPHQGSELADLLYSDWADWLVRLLGGQNDATYSMTTGYMQHFRALTDGLPENDAVQYYSGAGTDWGPAGSVLPMGGAYLSTFGPNDGLVTVASTELPGGQTLFVQPYHHFNIHMGHTSFPWIDAVLRDGMGPYRIYLPLVSSRVGSPHPSGPMRQEVDPALVSGVILRGGRLSGPVIEVVPIEPHARAATFDLLVSDEAVKASLTGPDGVPRRLQAVAGRGQGLFGTTFHWIHVATQPVAGEWTLGVDGPPGAAYLLVTSIDSPLQVTLRGLPEQPVAPRSILELSADVDGPLGRPVVHQIETHITRSLPGQGRNRLEVKSDIGPILHRAPSGEGIYVVSATVTGETAEGMAFERSFVRSFAVVKPETLRGEPTLPDR